MSQILHGMMVYSSPSTHLEGVWKALHKLGQPAPPVCNTPALIHLNEKAELDLIQHLQDDCYTFMAKKALCRPLTASLTPDHHWDLLKVFDGMAKTVMKVISNSGLGEEENWWMFHSFMTSTWKQWKSRKQKSMSFNFDPFLPWEMELLKFHKLLCKHVASFSNSHVLVATKTYSEFQLVVTLTALQENLELFLCLAVHGKNASASTTVSSKPPTMEWVQPEEVIRMAHHQEMTSSETAQRAKISTLTG
ncbi:hypothetical protein C8J57DRAFT_1220935 [Mycena rebaudengoi]|nr:hypothetical protein C8J57DRAFT_1220935 [Mycena rebaudengoi]